MNHKGQVLVLFALLLPLILLFVGLIVDTGYLYVEKRRVDIIVKDTVEYGMKNIEEVTEEELYILLEKNLDNIVEKKITKKDGILTIKVTVQKNSIFSYLFKKDKYEIITTYKGMYENNKLKIVRG